MDRRLEKDAMGLVGRRSGFLICQSVVMKEWKETAAYFIV